MSRLSSWGRGAVGSALLMCIVHWSAPGQAAPTPSYQLQLRKARARFEGRVLKVQVGRRGRSPAGTLTLSLENLRGRRLAVARQQVTTGHRGPVTLRLSVPARHRRAPDLLRLVASFSWRKKGRGLQRQVAALSEIGDMPFVWLRGQARLTAGSRADLRVTVRDLQRRPLPGAKVSLSLTARGKTIKSHGVAQAAGGLQLAFSVPQTWAGLKARLRVTARTAVFSRTVAQVIRIRRSVDALLLTDKPIYQPGQTVHLRLLVLRQPSRKPLARAKVRFSAVDPRGNRLVVKTARTDAFGVA